MVDNMTAYFMISLDTELQWGYKLYPNSKMANIIKNREDEAIHAIEDILKIFEKYNISGTWAIVGQLFLSNYDMIEKIRKSVVAQDIGYHSFTHIPFSECSYEDVEEEIRKKKELEFKFDINFDSFIFPENKIGKVDILKKYGFKIYRGPNLAGKNINRNLIIKIKNHLVNKIISPSVTPIWRDGIWEIPSSMILFDNLCSGSLVYRAKNGIQKAINDKKNFHIFMHPEDLLIEPNLINQLEEILKFVSKKRRNKEIQIVTMSEFASILNKFDQNS